MAVRLSDLRSGKKTDEEEKKKKGGVRLSDIRAAKTSEASRLRSESIMQPIDIEAAVARLPKEEKKVVEEKKSGVRLSDIRKKTEVSSNPSWGYSTVDRSNETPYRPVEKKVEKKPKREVVLRGAKDTDVPLTEKQQKEVTKGLNKDLRKGFNVPLIYRIMNRVSEGTMEAGNAIGLGIPDAITGHTIANRPDYEKTAAGTVGKVVGEIAGFAKAYKLTKGIANAALRKGAGRAVERELATQGIHSPKMAEEFIRGGIAEGAFGAGKELADVAFDTRQNGNEGIVDRAKNVATASAYGAVGDAGLAGMGAMAREIFDSVKARRASKVTQPVPESVQPTNDQIIPESVDEVVQPKSVRLADLRAETAATGTTATRGTRANFANQLDNGNFSDELQQNIRNTDQTYEVKTNQSSVDAADEALKDMSQATSRFLNNEAGGAEHIATGYKLMQRLDALGKHEEALTVSRKLAIDLTNSGQTTQAASIISRLSPEGQLLNLVRLAEKNGKEVTVADSVKFKELAAKVQENAGAGIRANQFNEILNRMEKGENVSVADIKNLSDYLSGAEKVIQPKTNVVADIVDDLPDELTDYRKRGKIISFLDDAEQAALARIAARKNRLNALPVDEWADHAIVASAQIAKGTIKAATHVEDLVKMFGEEIRPYANQVFQKAQGLVKSVSRRAGEGNLERATDIMRRASGQSDADKAVVEETAKHVKKLIEDAKAGMLDPADIQKLRDYSDEIAEMTKDAKPRPMPTQEEKFLQAVKSLAKKIAKVESEKIPTDQANREVSSLLRQIVKISDEGAPGIRKQPIDNKALSDIAHDVMEKTRPAPKPTTLQEKIVEKYLKENPQIRQADIATLRKLAKNVTRLSGDAKIDADIAMQRILNSYEKSTVWDKVQSLRYLGMLLNTGTQLVNAGSGPIMATTGYAADVFGSMLDIAISKALKTPRSTTLYSSNPLRFIAGYMKHLKTGVRAGWHGVNPSGIQSTNEIRGLAFKSMKNPLTFVPAIGERVLGAVSKGADYATYRTVYDAEIAKQGFLSAKNNGIRSRAEIKKHVQDFVNDPPEEAILQADRTGKNTTFQRSDTTGGKVANYLNSGPTIVKPVVNAVVPFVRTPINMASSAVTLTPAGIIKGLYQLSSKSGASRREAIRTLSLGVTGIGIGAVGFHLFDIGIITGGNDSGDKNVDAIREQAGKGKYRFNTSALVRYLGSIANGEGSTIAEKKAQYQEGDEQFDYNKLQPLAFPLAAGASLAENKDKQLAGQIAKAGEDSYGSLFGMSTLKGVQNVFQPSYGGTQGEKSLGTLERVGESFLKSFSWGGLAQEARRQDPIQRKTAYNDGIVANTTEYFQSRTPGQSQKLPARKTTLGQDYKNAPGFKGAYLNPYRSEVAPYNEAAQIIAGLIDRTGDMKLAPTAPEKSVSGSVRGKRVTIQIPKGRYETLQEDIGDEIIKRILELPELDDAKMAERIEDIYTDVRKKNMNEVKREFGIEVR